MPSIAANANPGSYSQAHWTCWATARTTCRAACGSASLVSFDIARSVPTGFIAKLRPKLRPRSIDRGFSLRSIGQRSCNNVADYNQTVFTRQFRRNDMQVVPACVSDFRMNGLNPPPLPGALCLGKDALVFFEMTRILNLVSIRQRGERYQPKIDANFAGSAGPSFGDLDNEVEIPATARVLCETAGFDSTVYGTTAPKPIPAPDVSYRVASERDRTPGRKGNPTKALFPAPTRTARGGIAIDDELLADGLNSIAMQTKQRACSGCQPDKGKGAWPRPFGSSSHLLCFATEVPDIIHCSGMSTESLSGRCVLDAVSVGENHEVRVSYGLMLGKSRPLRNVRKCRGDSSVRSSRRRKLGNAPDRCNVEIYRCVGEQ
jgi:hypothetical protein